MGGGGRGGWWFLIGGFEGGGVYLDGVWKFSFHGRFGDLGLDLCS